AVERYRAAGLVDRGIARFLGRALASGAANPQEAAERLAFAPELDHGDGGPDEAAIRAALKPHTEAALGRIDRARAERDGLRARIGTGPTPHKYVIVATG